MSEQGWGRFWHHVIETQQCGQAVDFFDLNGDNLESVQKWLIVVQHQSQAALELIEMVLANSESLRAAAREDVADAIALIAKNNSDTSVYED